MHTCAGFTAATTAMRFSAAGITERYALETWPTRMVRRSINYKPGAPARYTNTIHPEQKGVLMTCGHVVTFTI
jgi:hypothetical protein